MKRSWFGAALLAALLVLSLLTGRWLGRCCDPASEDLAAAGERILAGDWDGAEGLIRGAEEHWERYRPYSAVMGNQGDLEEVESLLARLKIYLQTRDPESAPLCAEIARRMADMNPAGNWWDLI